MFLVAEKAVFTSNLSAIIPSGNIIHPSLFDFNLQPSDFRILLSPLGFGQIWIENLPKIKS